MANAQGNFAVTLGGTAQDMLPARLGRAFLEIDPITEDCWINFGETAAVDNGVLVRFANDEPKKFYISDTPDIGGRVSVFSATTAAKINYREA